jgi:hypothetical protein
VCWWAADQQRTAADDHDSDRFDHSHRRDDNCASDQQCADNHDDVDDNGRINDDRYAGDNRDLLSNDRRHDAVDTDRRNSSLQGSLLQLFTDAVGDVFSSRRCRRVDRRWRIGRNDDRCEHTAGRQYRAAASADEDGRLSDGCSS